MCAYVTVCTGVGGGGGVGVHTRVHIPVHLGTKRVLGPWGWSYGVWEVSEVDVEV